MGKQEFLRYVQNLIGTTEWLKIRQYISKLKRERDMLYYDANTCSNCAHFKDNSCTNDLIISIWLRDNDMHNFKCNKWEIDD